MSTDAALKNRGIIPFGPQAEERPRTLVVLGAGRGGTSLVAGMLAKLGVFMGQKARPPVFEDVRLARAIEAEQWEEVQAIVREYDEQHEVWGFKRPSLVCRLAPLHPMLRSPFYVATFRDLAAIARRNMISMRDDSLAAMRAALSSYSALLEFMARDDVRGLAISNEKALLHPKEFMESLIHHCGLSHRASAERREAAQRFVAVDPPDYLERTYLRFVGFVDRVTREYVSGWAWIPGQTNPVTLSIKVSGRIVGSTKADRMRRDVKKRGRHPTGTCGFSFEFPPEDAPGPGDEVTVQFERGGDHVSGSPWTVEEPRRASEDEAPPAMADPSPDAKGSADAEVSVPAEASTSATRKTGSP